MDKIRLYGYATSPYVMKVGCYLKYKQLPFDFVPVNPMSPVQIKFTGQRQVPVLSIGEEWRIESSQLGIWLDETFPEKPLLGHTLASREKILSIDDWVSDQLIPSRFRAAVEWQNSLDSIRNGWKLSRAVNEGTKIPRWVRILWPYFIRRATFIVDMVNELDVNQSFEDMWQQLYERFIEHLDEGPFLGGQSQVSLADLSAYPTIVSGYLMGMHADSPFYHCEEVIGWCRRVQAELPANPLMVPDRLIERQHL